MDSVVVYLGMIRGLNWVLYVGYLVVLICVLLFGCCVALRVVLCWLDGCLFDWF